MISLRPGRPVVQPPTMQGGFHLLQPPTFPSTRVAWLKISKRIEFEIVQVSVKFVSLEQVGVRTNIRDLVIVDHDHHIAFTQSA